VTGREVNEMEDGRLVEFAGEVRQELFNLRLQHATGQLENTSSMGARKRDLARALTVARARGIDVDRELRRQADG
jgi:large subunit ribosomal protein L29